MRSSPALTGVFPVLPTIFFPDGRCDEDQTLAVARFVIDSGADGFVYPGLASEYDCLTHEERVALTHALGKAKGDRLFVCGASAASVEEAETLARQGAEAGCDAVMILTPRLLEDGTGPLREWYGRLGDRIGVPLMIQNAPVPMGSGLPMDRIADLVAAVPAIRYVKEEGLPSGQRLSQLARLTASSGTGLFGGAGARYLLDELHRGASGTMPASEIADCHVAIVAAFHRGDHETARHLFERTLPLLSMQAVFRWRLTKEVLRRRGIIRDVFTRAAGPALDADDLRELGVLLDRLKDLFASSPAPLVAA